MATVILTAVGTAIGGPIGGALGAILGQQIDRSVLGSGKPREGARIKELDVQTSSYGTQIPAVYGAMRVAGTVIWSTDLIERRTKSGGSKSRPATVNYSYSVSFAVALSSRPVARVGRIWADGNLLRGAAGDFKTETGFRFHNGYGDQPVDPLLASAEALGQNPAYRDMAYAVFEDLQLADFGNRIPSLTFELFEREVPVPLMDIVNGCSAGWISGPSSIVLAGFAAQGGDCRAVLQPLLASLPFTVSPSAEGMKLADWSATSDVTVSSDPVVKVGNAPLDRPSQVRAAKNQAPAMISIRHYEPERDFQAGIQSSRRTGTARNELQIELAAAVNAPLVRNYADLQLLQRWRNLNGYEVTLSTGPELSKVGDQLSMAGNSAALRITGIEHQRGFAKITASEWVDTFTLNLIADPGRNLSDPDLVIGETHLLLADLPAMGNVDPESAVIVAAAAGSGPGWRRAALSVIDGDTVIELGGTNGVSTLGQLVEELPVHSAMVLDLSNQPVIRLLHEAMTLPPGSGDPLAFDAPILWIDGEIIRYGNAAKIGPRDYRLSQLQRGCFGTGQSLIHSANADIFLIEAENVTRIEGIPTPAGAVLTVEAYGLADNLPIADTVSIQGYAITPPAPVHGQAEKLADGAIALNWIRRERLVFAWADGADVPSSEGLLEFSIALSLDGIVVENWTSVEAALVIDAASLALLSIPAGSAIQFSIVQQGRFARSAPLIIEMTT